MSGHGGGGGVGAGDEITECASLIFRTTLNSPDPTVLNDLAENDVLSVRRTGPGNRRIVAVTEQGATAGSITHGKQVDLLRCLEDGVPFVARVERVSGGACDVQVRPKAG